jgi:uncharacterized membrane protein YdjX (TVP38/TMEM64 family)
MTRGGIFRALAGAAVIGGIVWGVRSTPELSCALIQSYGTTTEGTFVVIASAIAAILIGMPRWFVIIGCGMVFGFVIGAVVSQLAAWVGACIAFAVARYIAKDFVTKLLVGKRWFRGFGERLGTNGTAFATFLRLNPMFHFTVFSYACGLIPIGFWPYAIGSAIGMLPASVALAYAAETVGCAMIDPDRSVSPEAQAWLAGAFVISVAVSALPMILTARKRAES